MSQQPVPPRSPRASLLRWGSAWAALTLASTVAHSIVWMSGGSGAGAGSWALKVAVNIVHVLTSPAWLVINTIRYKWGYGSVFWTVMAMGLGWAILLYAFWGLSRQRRRVLRPRPAEPHVQAGPDLSRRRLVFDGVATAAGIVVVGGIVKGAAFEPWDLQVRRYSVPVQDLPASLDGLRIVQISDTHLGPRIPAEYVRRAVAMAIALKPDVFALTGDYIHAAVDFIEPAAELFRVLNEGGRAGTVIGTLGNHDWYNDGKAMRAALQRVGVRMIDNDRLFLDAQTRKIVPGVPATGLCLAGVGDLLEDWVDIETALQNVPYNMPRIVLAHNPDTAEQKSVTRDRAPRIDLMLSGHTHGGQVRIPGLGTPFLPSAFGQKYAGGLCQGPRCRVLVSRGVGMSIFPVRLGVPPELVEITLTRA